MTLLNMMNENTPVLKPRKDFDQCIMAYDVSKDQVYYSYEALIELCKKANSTEFEAKDFIDWALSQAIKSYSNKSNVPKILRKTSEEDIYNEIKLDTI